MLTLPAAVQSNGNCFGTTDLCWLAVKAQAPPRRAAPRAGGLFTAAGAVSTPATHSLVSECRASADCWRPVHSSWCCFHARHPQFGQRVPGQRRLLAACSQQLVLFPRPPPTVWSVSAGAAPRAGGLFTAAGAVSTPATHSLQLVLFPRPPTTVWSVSAGAAPTAGGLFTAAGAVSTPANHSLVSECRGSADCWRPVHSSWCCFHARHPQFGQRVPGQRRLLAACSQQLVLFPRPPPTVWSVSAGAAPTAGGLFAAAGAVSTPANHSLQLVLFPRPPPTVWSVSAGPAPTAGGLFTAAGAVSTPATHSLVSECRASADCWRPVHSSWCCFHARHPQFGQRVPGQRRVLAACSQQLVLFPHPPPTVWSVSAGAAPRAGGLFTAAGAVSMPATHSLQLVLFPCPPPTVWSASAGPAPTAGGLFTAAGAVSTPATHSLVSECRGSADCWRAHHRQLPQTPILLKRYT
ncbi:uncharacterized protein LOC126204389 [Schistocerca nitens]|uniref:uncharacterized protein LOC126204389 n=1 Tax=Schistocerca nitens TaxID=7011 RepID=UPI002119191A|nr:uncharacterized protein LOC126204389 [Schistocerca nitens]